MNNEEILSQIEALREALNNYNCENSLIDPSVIALSKRLDELLNEYYKVLQKNKIK